MVELWVSESGSAAREVPDRLRFLRSLPLLSGASERAIHDLARLARARTYEVGERIFRKGEPSDALLLLISGRVVVSSLSPDGHEVILNIIQSGEVVGEIGVLDGGPRTADATASHATMALALMRRDFLPLLRADANLAHALLLLLCSRLRQTTSFVEDAVLEQLPARLLHRLEALARTCGRVERGGGVRIEHGLSQKALGDAIGASRVSVNRQLNAWRALGLLEFGPGFVAVRDMARLAAEIRTG
jgi:CRP-like cAMP-binding protein